MQFMIKTVTLNRLDVLKCADMTTDLFTMILTAVKILKLCNPVARLRIKISKKPLGTFFIGKVVIYPI